MTVQAQQPSRQDAADERHLRRKDSLMSRTDALFRLDRERLRAYLTE
jgi:hypothetical protein